jgi:hypothetical protein
LRRCGRRSAIVDGLEPYRTAEGGYRLEDGWHTSRPRIQEAIDQLVEAGVLVLLSEGRRNRQWEAAGILDLLADLEAGIQR